MHIVRQRHRLTGHANRIGKRTTRALYISAAVVAVGHTGAAHAEDQPYPLPIVSALPVAAAEVSTTVTNSVTQAAAPVYVTADVLGGYVEEQAETRVANANDAVPMPSMMPLSYRIGSTTTATISHGGPDQTSMTNLTRLASPSWEADLYSVQQRRYGFLDTGDAQLNAAVYGPVDAAADGPGGTLDENDARYNTIGGQIGAVKWEVLGVAAYLTATNLSKLINVGGRGFSFQNEGWFGRDTNNLGIDKLAHAYNSYLFSEIFYHRIRHRVGDRPNAALTGALLGWGVQFFGVVWDGFKSTSGFSMQDLITNTAGAGISYLRNVVPGMREKVDFRVLIMPNSDIYSFNGKRHYEQQRFMLAVTLAGFRQFENTPLRFLELHVGYHATGFTPEQVANGERLRRHVFVGVGINLNELLFGSRPRTGAARAASAVFDYLQIPYTAVHF